MVPATGLWFVSGWVGSVVVGQGSYRGFPSFLVMGAARAGSTWLYAVLQHHRQIFLPEIKEPDFFNRRILTENLGGYLADYRGTDVPARSFSGDMSVNYAMLRPSAVAQVARLIPYARLIYTLRYPVDRLWSQLKYDYSLFSHRPLERVPLFRFLRACESPRLTRRSDYLRVIKTWATAFGKSSLHVELFDRMEQDPEGYVTDILRHIGADTDFQIPPELLDNCVNSTPELEIPPILRWYISTKWLEPTRQLNDYLGGAVSHWVERLREDAAHSTGSRRLMRALNRTVLTLPHRIAYTLYDWRRHHALMKRYAEEIPKHEIVPMFVKPAPGIKAAQRDVHVPV